MKTLIISENENIIQNFNDIFSKKGFDTIIYKWLLKALDNIEEIRPDCVVLSSSEYPRHWKTLVQFIKSGIGGQKIAIFLYESENLSEKEKNKAKALGITSFVHKFDEDDFLKLEKKLNSFFEITDKSVSDVCSKTSTIEEETFTVENIVSEIKNTARDNQNNQNNSNSFILTHPKTKKFIFGSYFDKNNDKITAKVFNVKDFDLQKNEKIESFTYSYKNNCVKTCATICDFIDINKEKFIIFKLG